jgi:hypothetical protein
MTTIVANVLAVGGTAVITLGVWAYALLPQESADAIAVAMHGASALVMGFGLLVGGTAGIVILSMAALAWLLFAVWAHVLDS